MALSLAEVKIAQFSQGTLNLMSLAYWKGLGLHSSHSTKDRCGKITLAKAIFSQTLNIQSLQERLQLFYCCLYMQSYL